MAGSEVRVIRRAGLRVKGRVEGVGRAGWDSLALFE